MSDYKIAKLRALLEGAYSAMRDADKALDIQAKQIKELEEALAKEKLEHDINYCRWEESSDALDAEVDQLQKEKAGLEDIIRAWFEQSHDRNKERVDSPNHGHKIKGVWDSDNGELAGKECAQCKLWRKAKALAQVDKEK